MKTVETKDELSAIIKESKTLVVVDFFATWCGPCKAIAPKLAQWSTDYEGEVLFVKVDVDENEEAAEENNITAMPTFLFFKDGVKVAEVTGANEAKLLEAIKQYK